MEIIHLTHQNFILNDRSISFALRLHKVKEIWLFNCSEGCQHHLTRRQIKISQISKIIVTELQIDSISGLLGLLSSLSLINRKKILHIYGPIGIEQYLSLGTKYSKTRFRYSLNFYNLKTGLIISHDCYRLYAFVKRNSCELLIISSERYGKFHLNKAQNFSLKSGPIYGKLKKNLNFLLPDGSVIDGISFTEKSESGRKMMCIINPYHNRKAIEINSNTDVLKYISI